MNQSFLFDGCRFCFTCQSPLHGEQRKYCSKRCNEKAREKRSPRSQHRLTIAAVCQNCKKEYHPKTKDRMTFCSRQCYYSCKVERSCVVCSQSFIGGFHQKACSPACRKRLSSIAVSKVSHRRRALLANAPAAPYDPLAIFDRDGWACRGCGKRVSRTVAFPHPDFATIDHVIPIAKGGGDTPDNLQCLCLPCNHKKSASLDWKPGRAG